MKDRNAPKLSILCVTLLLLLVNASAAPADSILEKLLPENPGVEGWRLAGKYYHYLPDNLYNYINGAADLFNSYGFVRLTGVEYVSGKDDSVTVDIYDMGNKLNAFGVYQSKRDPEKKPLKIGTGAFGGKEYVFLYKDRLYVEIKAFLSGDTNKDVIITMARKLASRMAGDSAPPSELNLLPDPRRVGGSEMYITGGILGHAFLDRGLVSNYEVGGTAVKAFIAFFPSKEDAVKAFGKYKDFLTASGEEWKALDGFGEQGFVSREPYHKNLLVAQEGSFVAGVSDLPRAEDGKGLLKNLVEKIAKPL
jgi:hypothetical protein